mgnify:CR=1 FL=1
MTLGFLLLNNVSKLNVQNKPDEQEVMKVNSLEEAKQKVIELVNKGLSYREISKIAFEINGKARRFSIGTISSWVNKKEIGSKDSEAFKLFKDGKGPIDAVIELGLNPEEAKQLYDLYSEMKNATIKSKGYTLSV